VPALEVRPVEGRRSFTDFLNAPRRVYAGDPNWVPPLDFERRTHLSSKNPYFRHARARYFVAYRDGAAVGRISAQIDELAQNAGPGVIGHFGLLEGTDGNALAMLLEAAEAWLHQQDVQRVEGPYSLSINDEVGLFVDGREGPPRLLMNYAPAAYAEALEAAGYEKAKDLLAYRVDVEARLPRAAEYLAQQAARSGRVTERAMNPRRFRAELDTVLDIFNDAWSDNWGFVPMTADEVAYMAANLKPLIRPELVRIADVDGEPAAMLVAVPDLNEALRGIDGRLLPLGWARLLWRLKVRGPRGGRVLLMGVRKKYRSGFMAGALTALLVSEAHRAARRHGLDEVEMSWILEDNMPIRRLIEMVGGEVYRRYRIYGKALA
jgi:hypothetical protein